VRELRGIFVFTLPEHGFSVLYYPYKKGLPFPIRFIKQLVGL
jgi:hypothetical protein